MSNMRSLYMPDWKIEYLQLLQARTNLQDVYYLKLERKFRFLFDQVRLDKHEVDFTMKLMNDPLDILSVKARTWDCIKYPISKTV